MSNNLGLHTHSKLKENSREKWNLIADKSLFLF